MQIRKFIICSGGALSLGLLAASQAHAAVTVLGAGLAQSCYEAAEYGGNPRDGIVTCTTALDDIALTKSDRAATHINRGILRSRAGDHDGALADYNEGLTQVPALAEGYIDRGATYIVMKRYDDAVTDIDKGIALNAKRPHIAYYDRAIAYEALGNVRGAYEDYKKAVALQPDFTLASEQLSRFKVVRQKNDGM